MPNLAIGFLKNDITGNSKRAVAAAVIVKHTSVQTWPTLYEQAGIEAILKHERKDGRPSNITAEEHNLIEEKLHDPKSGLGGWMDGWIDR